MSVGPLDASLDDGARPRSIGQQCQRRAHDRLLNGCVTSRTQGRPVREVDEQRPGRPHIFGDVPVHHNANGWDALLFDGPGNQSHGLLANGSAWRQENGIHAVRRQAPGHHRGGFGY